MNDRQAIIAALQAKHTPYIDGASIQAGPVWLGPGGPAVNAAGELVFLLFEFDGDKLTFISWTHGIADGT